MTGRIEFLLGVPTLRNGTLWRAVRRLDAPTVVSANGRWTTH